MNPKLIIEVESRLVHFKIELNHKVSVITGHSGVGKSVLSKALEDDSGRYKRRISIPGYSFVVIHGGSWEDNYRAAVIDSENLSNNARIFVFDDVDYMKTEYFSTLFSKDKRNFYIFINRFSQFNGLKESSLGRVPYSIYSVYNLVTDGRNHWLEPKYSFDVKPDTFYDCVIIEDETSGFEFLRCYNASVSSSKSKDNILVLLEKNLSVLRMKKVLVFADLASFGSCIRSLLEFAQGYNIDISLVQDYQCFEYLLLTSNLVEKIKSKEQILAYSNSIKNVVRFSSLEKLYEYLLSYVTKDTSIHQSHGGSLNSCYYTDCQNCKKNKRRQSCNYGLKGNKQKALVQGTQWEEVLSAVRNSDLILLKF